MKTNILYILMFLVTSSAVAQYKPEKVGKKAAQQYIKGLEAAVNGDFTDALKILGDAVKLDRQFLDAYLSIGGIYSEMKNYALAIENYEKAKAIDSLYFKDYALPYSINLAGAGQFRKALDAANYFLSIPNLNASSRNAGEYRKKSYLFAIEFEKKQQSSAYKFDPKNLGDSVNSDVSEYFPAITVDGQQLFYTRRVNNRNEDFYVSKLVNGTWSKSFGLHGNINTPSNEGGQNISQDGEWLIFTGCDFPDGFGSCDLYISYLTSDGWSEPENLGKNINSEAWESAPSLSPDKRHLYFASNRSGGYGKSDIYVSELQPNGRYGPPQNLGPLINTAGNESCPFIHADNQTLYFTSDGHVGYGGDDLFLSRKNAEDWSEAENLGYPINTIENEGSLVVAANGLTAYYASDRSDSRGGLDIYSFELREDIRPAKTLWVKGRVFDNNTKKGLPSTLELTDLSNRRLISKVQTDESGNYLITLPVGRDYAFNVNRKGYLFHSENIPLSEKNDYSTNHVDIPLLPITRDAVIELKNVFFDVNSFHLRKESFAELDNVVKLLKDNSNISVSINGHTDNTGNSTDNLKLSVERAKAVVQYLIDNNIEKNRLVYKGFGASQPKAENSTEDGRARNRRTEMKIIN